MKKLLIISLIFSFALIAEAKIYKHSVCSVKITSQKGAFYKKLKNECRKLKIYNKNGKLIKIVDNAKNKKPKQTPNKIFKIFM